MTRLPGDVPQRYRISPRRVSEPRHARDPLGHLALRRACRPQATQVTLDVGGEHGHAGIAENLCQVLQGDGLACTGGTGDQAVPVGQAHGLIDRLAIRASAYNYLRRIRHLFHPLLKLCRASADTSE
ncbi:hypothetical protein D3C76_867370 [compost metagenome]